MAPIIQSAGELATIEGAGGFTIGTTSRTGTSLTLYNQVRQSYAEIIRTQPNVRTVISFLARNIAQLGVHLFERLSDEDRARIRDHTFAEALRKPNPRDRRLTTYRLMHRTVWDCAAFDIAFWALVDVPELGRPVIVPLQPHKVEILGSLWATGYRYHGARGVRDFTPEQIVVFQASHNLDDPLWGTSPIETLRRTIAEEAAAGEYREQFWRSGARISGVIERPVTAPDWSDGAKTRFKTDWDGLYTGHGPAAGGTPILEDGMVWKEAGSADARSAQYVEARKLSREEAAAAYHVDPIWVGITEGGAAFASVKERHKALYADTLGPWVVMLEQDLTFQALPAFEAEEARADRLYIKINTAEKLRGTPEDLAEALTRLTGRPALTVNEARGLLDRNSHPDGDGLTIPLNVVVGGQTIPGEAPPGTASVGAPARAALGRGAKAGLTQAQHAALLDAHRTVHRLAVERTFNRQRAEVLAELGARADGATVEDLFNRDRWDDELAVDLFGPALALAAEYGETVAESLAFDDFDPALFEAFLSESTRIAAENINFTTAEAIAAALDDEDEEPAAAVRHMFEVAAVARAAQIAQTRVTATAGFAAEGTANQAGRTVKVWNVTSSNSRHPELDGDTAPIGEPFSNGMQYPGDALGGADQTAGCTCLLTFE